MEEVKTVSLNEEKLKAFLENLENIYILKKLFKLAYLCWEDVYFKLFINILILYLANSSNFDEIIEFLRNIKLKNNENFWIKIKTFLSDENYINSIKSIIQEDTPFMNKVRKILSEYPFFEQLIKTFLIYKNIIDKEIFINYFVLIAFLEKILIELIKNINYLIAPSDFGDVFEIIKGSDIETYYKIVFKEIYEEVKQYDEKDIEIIIQRVCPFLVSKEIKDFVHYVIEAKNYEDIVNYLKNKFLNKEQFEKFIVYLSNKNIDVEFKPYFSIIDVFYVIKLLMLLDDLNENPRYYLDKIIEIISNKLKTILSKINENYEKSAIAIIITNIVQNLTEPWVLELIKYCSTKENKTPDNILNEIFQHFEREFPEYIDCEKITQIFSKVLETKECDDILKKEITRLTLDNREKFIQVSFETTLEIVKYYL